MLEGVWSLFCESKKYKFESLVNCRSSETQNRELAQCPLDSDTSKPQHESSLKVYWIPSLSETLTLVFTQATLNRLPEPMLLDVRLRRAQPLLKQETHFLLP